MADDGPCPNSTCPDDKVCSVRLSGEFFCQCAKDCLTGGITDSSNSALWALFVIPFVIIIVLLVLLILIFYNRRQNIKNKVRFRFRVRFISIVARRLKITENEQQAIK